VPEPKIRLRVERGRIDDDGNVKVYFHLDPETDEAWLPERFAAALESALAENAGLREALEAAEAVFSRCGNESSTLDPSAPGLWCDLPAGHAGWHGADQPAVTGFSTRAEWTYEAPSAPSEPVQDQPRVWAMPEIPEDVTAVRDRNGNTWARIGPSRSWDCTSDKGGYYRPLTSFELLRGRGPLSEVVEPDGD
jgi:hypothetical protein